MTVRQSGIVTAVLLAVALASTGIWIRSFWVNDIWEKQVWVSSARRNDWVAIASIAGRLRWGRGGMVFSNPKLVSVYEYNSARTGTRQWEYGWRRVDARERAGWYLPSWKPTARTTPDWSMTAVTVNVPYWPVVVGAWWAAGRRVRRRARLRRWAREGRCLACGYDLRASPGTCPECGTSAGVGGGGEGVEVRDVV